MVLPAIEKLNIRKKLKDDEIYAAFGGGIGKFGANFSLFHYKKTTIWIDVGAGFESKEHPGISKRLPNLRLLKEFPPSAIILTHAHEDHIGAFPYSIEFIPDNVPVITAIFTYNIVKERLKEIGVSVESINFKIIDKNDSFPLKGMQLFFFFMPHSIPHSFSVGIHIKDINKKLYFTSDFKTKGNESRFSARDISNFAPVDILFCDSTGSLKPGYTDTEENVLKNIEKIIKDWHGRVFLTTFSSNVERIRGIFKIAEKTGRRVGILGRSIHNYLKIAFSSNEFHIPVRDINRPSAKDKNTIWIVSGCQGDENSSFYHLVKGSLPGFSLRDDDLMIYSSSMIPENQERIYNCINSVASSRTKVIGFLDEQKLTHSSGHGRKDDILQMVKWLKPSKILPIHGDTLHFHSFAQIIPENKLYILDSKYIYSLKQDIQPEWEIVSDPYFLDGNELHNKMSVLQARSSMEKNGICNVLIQRSGFKLLKVDYVGVVSQYPSKDHDMLHKEIEMAIQKTDPTKNESKIEKKLKKRIFHILQMQFRKKPYINLIWI